MSPGPAPRLVYLLDTWPWFGQHNGYTQLAETIAADGIEPRLVASTRGTAINAVASRLYAISHSGAWCCAGRDRPSEAAFLREWQAHPGGVGHVLYFERHHPLFQQWRRAPAGLVVTVHHPPNQMREWHPAVIEDLRRVVSAIALYQRDLEFFEQCVGRGRVKFVRYGVDTDFFRPSAEQLHARARRLLFVGVNGRNLEMLSRVIKRLAVSHPELRYDLLVPGFRRKPREALRLVSLWHHPKVTWHVGLSDDELRRLYQSSYLLLLPLQHAGVCNAIVEALACGLPVVTTDVGGVRDYGGGTVYPVVPNNDDNAMIDIVEDYLASPDFRQDVGSRCRRFAEEALTWSKSRQAHLEAYRTLAE